jgi:hypothetical protein
MKKEFIELTVKSAEVIAKMTEAELTEYKSINDDAQKNNLEVAKAFQKESEAKVSELETALKAQSSVIEGLKTKETGSLASMIQKKNESIKTAITEIAQKGKASFELDTKVVTSGSVVDGTDQYFYGLQGIGKQPVRMLVMESLFSSVNIGANSGGTIRYTDQDVLTRGADNVANCSLFPSSDITWKTSTDSIKKIADSIPVCKDAMEDFGFIESEVNNFILENLRLKLDQQL